LPSFNVLVHGTGIEYPQIAPVDQPPSVGFRRVECVRAANEAEARAEAIAAVAADWDSPRYALSNRGAKPALTVERVVRVSLWHRYFVHRNGGHDFYCADSDAAP
jgi:hypothetical protein